MTFVLDDRPLADHDQILTPRPGHSAVMDALAEARQRGLMAATRRISEQFNELQPQVLANNSDANTLSIHGYEGEVDTVRLALDLGRIFGCPTTLGAAPPGHHFADHDRVLVATSPTPARVTAPVELSAVHGWSVDLLGEESVWEDELSPGIAAYLPRGWGLESDAEGLTTITIERFSVPDLVRELSHDAGHWPLLRADLPTDPLAPITTYDESIFSSEDRLASELAQLMHPTRIDSCLARLRARLASPARRAPGTAPPEADSIITLPSQAGIQYVGEQVENYQVAVDGRVLTLSVDTLAAVGELGAGERTRVVDFPVLRDATGALSLGQELHELGLITTG